MTPIPVTVFSDFTCPYSYVTEAALWRLAERGAAELRYGAFELYPAPAPAVAPAEETGWQNATAPLAQPLGLTLRAPGFRPRTRKAHEAFHFAAQQGIGAAMRERIFRAYWQELRDIGRVDVLMSLVAELGAEPEELKIALDIDRYEEQVLREEHRAEQLRVRAVPVVYLGAGPDARILIGAQSREALDAALRNR